MTSHTRTLTFTRYYNRVCDVIDCDDTYQNEFLDSDDVTHCHVMDCDDTVTSWTVRKSGRRGGSDVDSREERMSEGLPLPSPGGKRKGEQRSRRRKLKCWVAGRAVTPASGAFCDES